MATYLENSCSFGLRNVFLVSVPDCWFGFSHLGFWSGNLFLIASFPDLCLLVPFDSGIQFLLCCDLCIFFSTWCLCWDLRFNCIDSWSLHSYFIFDLNIDCGYSLEPPRREQSSCEYKTRWSEKLPGLYCNKQFAFVITTQANNKENIG